jgi:hypothetical protein
MLIYWRVVYNGIFLPQMRSKRKSEAIMERNISWNIFTTQIYSGFPSILPQEKSPPKFG